MKYGMPLLLWSAVLLTFMDIQSGHYTKLSKHLLNRYSKFLLIKLDVLFDSPWASAFNLACCTCPIKEMSFQSTLKFFLHQESLVRVAVWCIGEYGDMLVNNVGMLDIEDPITVSILLHTLLVMHLSNLHSATLNSMGIVIT